MNPSEFEEQPEEGAAYLHIAAKQDRFQKPTYQQIIKAAILFNDCKIDHAKLSDMVALANWIVDRLYENGDITIPSSKETK
jgi:hypothetical protein